MPDGWLQQASSKSSLHLQHRRRLMKDRNTDHNASRARFPKAVLPSVYPEPVTPSAASLLVRETASAATFIYIGVIIVFVTQGLHLIDSASLFAELGNGVVIGHVDDGLALHVLHPPPPVLPILLVSDKEADEHAGVHLPHVQTTQLSGVTGIDLLLGVLARVSVIRQGRPGVMGVQVEEVEPLDADEVVRR